MQLTDKIYVAGHTGLIGSAVMRRLATLGYSRVLQASHADLDLSDAAAVDCFFEKNSPDYVVLAAGRVGGIVENQVFPADFMNANLAIQLNVLKAAHLAGVKKLIFFASSCMYPRECPQPMAETALQSGSLEPTSLAYAISKLAGLQMCLAYNQQYGEKRFIPLIPNSAYGPHDNFDAESGHVMSGLIRRFHEAYASDATSVTIWGSGLPRREFIHADDIADAAISLLEGQTEALTLPLNVGTGVEISIKELAVEIARIVGYTGRVVWDHSKPDGAPRKLLDSGRLRAFGWKPSVDFEQGLTNTYRWYLENALDVKALA